MRIAILAVVPLWLSVVPLTAFGGEEQALPEKERLTRVIEYFEKNGIQLEPRERGYVVVKPATEKYWVTVYFRVFDLGATEKEMREKLEMINLAYFLNPKARIAMSYPGGTGKKPGKIDETAEEKRQREELGDKLLKLFKEYDPAPAKDK